MDLYNVLCTGSKWVTLRKKQGVDEYVDFERVTGWYGRSSETPITVPPSQGPASTRASVDVVKTRKGEIIYTHHTPMSNGDHMGNHEEVRDA